MASDTSENVRSCGHALGRLRSHVSWATHPQLPAVSCHASADAGIHCVPLPHEGTKQLCGCLTDDWATAHRQGGRFCGHANGADGAAGSLLVHGKHRCGPPPRRPRDADSAGVPMAAAQGSSFLFITFQRVCFWAQAHALGEDKSKVCSMCKHILG